MANMWWNSSSISSYFRTSLGSKSTPLDGMYNCLGDSKMIKKGSYRKLMKSYVASMKENETDNNTSDKKETVKKEAVLDKLLNKNNSAPKITNKYLDELLKKDKTYNNNGTKATTETTSTLDEKV